MHAAVAAVHVAHLAATRPRQRTAAEQPRPVLLEARRALDQGVARVQRHGAQAGGEGVEGAAGAALRGLPVWRDAGDVGTVPGAGREGGEVAVLAEVGGDGGGAAGVAEGEEGEELDEEVAAQGLGRAARAEGDEGLVVAVDEVDGGGEEEDGGEKGEGACGGGERGGEVGWEGHGWWERLAALRAALGFGDEVEERRCLEMPFDLGFCSRLGTRAANDLFFPLLARSNRSQGIAAKKKCAACDGCVVRATLGCSAGAAAAARQEGTSAPAKAGQLLVAAGGCTAYAPVCVAASLIVWPCDWLPAPTV